ncbi:MAG: tetratricopeptide repeat protein [Oscillospiraceae bacterium]|nr:tetratricopeptide repeat protein [Oscillospiraceae bacterium]
MDDYTEPCCCFDASQYTGTPDTSHVEHPLDIPEIIKGLDARNNSGRESEAAAYLENWLAEARIRKDWRAELSLNNELLGQYRRSGDAEKGIRTVNEVLMLLKAHSLGSTVSGATILLNAATTLKCFGRAAESVPIFRHVARVYADHLDPLDYRFAGLYNNMALSFADTGDYLSAEKHFTMASGILEKCPGTENDRAVTFCNLAELYDAQDPEDPRISACMEKAWDLLNTPDLPKDGYHAFTASKCVPTFDRLGYFLYASELQKRADVIYQQSYL